MWFLSRKFINQLKVYSSIPSPLLCLLFTYLCHCKASFLLSFQPKYWARHQLHTISNTEHLYLLLTRNLYLSERKQLLEVDFYQDKVQSKYLLYLICVEKDINLEPIKDCTLRQELILYKELTAVIQTGGALEYNLNKARRNAQNNLVCKQRSNKAHVG